MTTLEVKSIIENHALGLTNLQISKKLNIPVKKIMSTLNRHNLKSNRYEKLEDNSIKQLLIGSYLGDGHFSKTYTLSQESRLVLIHSVNQLEYLNWKIEKLKKVNLYNSISKREIITETGKLSIMYTTKSKTHIIFSKFRKEGYIDNDKSYINFDLINEINEEGFSIWYLDDGSVTNDGANITCNRLSFDDKLKLKELIYKNLGLIVNVTADSLYIPKTEMSKLIEIVNSHCPTSMKYKLIPYNQRGAHVKQDELLGSPREGNQQPSLDSNIFEGSTTNSRVLASNVEDSNADTSVLPNNL